MTVGPAVRSFGFPFANMEVSPGTHMPRRPLPILLLGLVTSLLAFPAAAQDRGSVAGRITDKRTGHAIAFASVTAVEAKKGGLTDSEGRYLIPGLPAGTYEIKVQFLGYEPASRPGVVVAGGRVATADFQLAEIVVRQEKEVQVTAERRLVDAKAGSTVRSVNAGEIRNLPVQTVNQVLQQQAGINTDAEQVHIRGGRADETVFMVNGVANRDLITGQPTAGSMNARSVAEVNVATGSFDVRYGNALSGVVEIKLKEGGDRWDGGLTLAGGSYGGRFGQFLLGGPISRRHNVSAIIDLSGTFYETRFRYPGEGGGLFESWGGPGGSYDRLQSGYEDAIFGSKFKYGSFFTPSQDNRWSGRLGLTWKPNPSDRWSFNFSKRIAIDQGFSRVFITATGDQGDPAYPWIWDHRIGNAVTIFEDNLQTSLEWRRTLGKNGYTDVQFSRYFNAQRQEVMGKHWSEYEEPYDAGLSDPEKQYDFFIDSGDDDTWQDRRSNTWGLQWSLLQRFRPHELLVGFEHNWQDVQYLTITDPWVYDPSGLGAAHDLWNVHPWVGSMYVRDKLDFEGFTANFGLRMDYWFLGREVEDAIADTSNKNISPETRREFYEDTESFFGRRYKALLTPRIMVAFPISENSGFFFNYGQFVQNPSYRYVYSKLTSVSSEAFPILGNPNLNPQVSVNYEIGGRHLFIPTVGLNASVFVKDIYDYPVATTFKRQSGTDLSDVLVYLNGHYARSKGFEVEIEKRRSRWWAGKLAYTFQETKGKSSDPNEAKVIQENGGDASETRLSESFVRWNRPHKLTASLDVRFDEEAPAALLRQFGVNVYVSGISGRSYTPASEDITQLAEPNSKNGPFQVTTDLRLNRWFRVGGRRLDISVQGTNIFNNHLIYRIDPQTGEGRKADVGSYRRSEYTSDDAYEYALVSQVDDPSNYGPGAQWRLQFDYDF